MAFISRRPLHETPRFSLHERIKTARQRWRRQNPIADDQTIQQLMTLSAPWQNADLMKLATNSGYQLDWTEPSRTNKKRTGRGDDDGQPAQPQVRLRRLEADRLTASPSPVGSLDHFFTRPAPAVAAVEAPSSVSASTLN